jgi:serine/threonine-protein kinase
MNYTLKSELGEGGMATVYLAEDHKFHTDVAVKMLKKEFVHNENIRKRFIAEARNMFKMSHPNIIKVTDLIEEGDTVAFVMEYVEGETLKQYIERKGKLKNQEIKNIFSQMLDALTYVHEQKLIHRDIKPSNFMIDKKGKVKLMDFGIAKNTDISSADYTQTGTNQSMGTPLYMSPEQIKSTKAVTLHSDIYSLGVVLWNMVTGQKPYDAKTTSTFELQTKIVNEQLPSTSTIFDLIIEKSTAKDLEERFKNCVEFKNNLENLQKEDNESTKAYTSQNSEKTIIENFKDKSVDQKDNSNINSGLVDLFLMANGKFFESHHIPQLRDRLLKLDESKLKSIQTLQFLDPTTSLVLSLLGGGLGIDRFIIGDTGLGVGKLLTCGGLGIWTIADWFAIRGATRIKNITKVNQLLINS